MNVNTRELRYLDKIENDVNERLWDLLVVHLIDVHNKVRKHGGNKDRLIGLLDEAVVNLRKGTNNFNRLSFYRYCLIICNKILKYDIKRQDLKDIKKDIIEKYTHSEHGKFFKIPLAYQINEVRLTYDTDYLCYLLKRCSKLKQWDRALYCLITVRLIEPDNEELDDYYKLIHANIKSKTVKQVSFEKPKNQVLALDSNVVISKILYDIGEYRIKTGPSFDLEKLGNYNRFVITESVAEEVNKHLEFFLVGTKKFCRDNPRFKYEEIKTVLKKRLNKMIEKYGTKIESNNSSIEKVKKFYMQYLEELEKILLLKIEGKYVSQKLRKLAQRESMLPEEGDLRLLAEAIQLSKEQETGILSKDKDFTNFKGEIFENFGVKVYG